MQRKVRVPCLRCFLPKYLSSLAPSTPVASKGGKEKERENQKESVIDRWRTNRGTLCIRQ